MRSFGKSLRYRLPALGLGLITAVGVPATLAAVAVLAAPAAMAQAKESKEFVETYDAAKKALQSKDYSGALSNAEKAAPLAKSAQAKLVVEGIKGAAYGGLGKKQEELKSLETQQGMSGVSPEMSKANKLTIAGLYAELHNDDKAVELTKAYIKDYGGTADQLAFVANYELKKKQYAEAIKDANIAIEMSKKAGKKAPEAWYRIILTAYNEQKDYANYYPFLEKVYAEYPKPEYMKQLIDRITKEPKFDASSHQLDVYRAYEAAKVELTGAQTGEFGELTMNRHCAGESQRIFSGLEKKSWAGVPADKATRFKGMAAGLVANEAKADAAGGMAKREADAANAGKGDQFVQTGECNTALGNGAKGVDLVKKGIAKGGLNDSEVAWAKLQLGIAQEKAGQKEDAKKSWAEISKADNGSGVLARDYLLIYK